MRHLPLLLRLGLVLAPHERVSLPLVLRDAAATVRDTSLAERDTCRWVVNAVRGSPSARLAEGAESRRLRGAGGGEGETRAQACTVAGAVAVEGGRFASTGPWEQRARERQVRGRANGRDDANFFLWQRRLVSHRFRGPGISFSLFHCWTHSCVLAAWGAGNQRTGASPPESGLRVPAV